MLKEKILFVLYNEDDWGADIPLKASPDTRLSFEEFYTLAKVQGVSVFRAHIDWYNTATQSFSKAWTFDDGAWKKVTDPPKPTALFDKIAGKYGFSLFEKKMDMSRHFSLLNSPTFRAFFDNKFNQYLVFGEWMPCSYLAENKEQFLHVLEQVASTKVVTKLLYGSGGKEVVIDSKEVLSKKDFHYPIIVQEFIPTAGVPGFSPAKEIADLRLVFINHELIYALSRVAKGNSLFTNFHQGATAVLVPTDRIPEGCLVMAKKIQTKLTQFEKAHYSLDFMFTTEGKPLFIEMNTTPGFDLLRIIGTPELCKEHTKKLLALFF